MRAGASTPILYESPREDPGNLLLVPSECYVGHLCAGLVLLYTNVTAMNLRHEPN